MSALTHDAEKAPGISPFLMFQVNSRGELVSFAPNANVPQAFDVEFIRHSMSYYPTSAVCTHQEIYSCFKFSLFPVFFFGSCFLQSVAGDLTEYANNEQCGFVQFAQNTLTDVSNMTCPQLHLVSLRECPVSYDIMAVQNGRVRLDRLAVSFEMSSSVFIPLNGYVPPRGDGSAHIVDSCSLVYRPPARHR